MNNNATPYDGTLPYIFFSVCHDNESWAIPIIERLAAEGFRVWFRKEYSSQADQMESLTNHLCQCKVYINIITKAFMNSHDQKNELTFSINSKKKIVAAMLEPVTFSLGVQRQLEMSRQITVNTASPEMFLDSLFRLPELSDCKGEQQQLEAHDFPSDLSCNDISHSEDSISLSQYHFAQDLFIELQSYKNDGIEELMEDDALISTSAEEGNNHIQSEAVEQQSGAKPSESKMTYGNDEEQPSIEDDAETEYSPSDAWLDSDAPTTVEKKGVPPILIHIKSKRFFEGNYPLTAVGRSGRECDIVLGEYGTISSHHVDMIIYNDKNYIVVKKSTNGTMINGVSKATDDRVEVGSVAELQLAGEQFLVLFNSASIAFREHNSMGILRSLETKECKYIINDVLELGRHFKWNTTAMSKSNIGRHHACIFYKSGDYYLEDKKSKNGTYINKAKIVPLKPSLIKDGDIISLGSHHFIFSIWKAED